MNDTIHDSVKGLLQDISRPTEERAPQADKIQPEQAADTTKTKDAGPETKPEISEEMIETGADLTIGLYDFSQTTLFSWLVKNKKDKRIIRLYGEGALDKLEMLINEKEASEDSKASVQVIRSFTIDEIAMLKITKKTDEILNGLPMTEQEKNLIKVPLMEMMKQHGGTLPPSWALILGFLQISGARVGELLMF